MNTRPHLPTITWINRLAFPASGRQPQIALATPPMPTVKPPLRQPTSFMEELLGDG